MPSPELSYVIERAFQAWLRTKLDTNPNVSFFPNVEPIFESVFPLASPAGLGTLYSFMHIAQNTSDAETAIALYCQQGRRAGEHLTNGLYYATLRYKNREPQEAIDDERNQEQEAVKIFAKLHSHSFTAPWTIEQLINEGEKAITNSDPTVGEKNDLEYLVDLLNKLKGLL